MTPQTIRDAIRTTYDNEAKLYAEFQDSSFAWQFIEKPGFDSYIKDLYLPQTRVLDIGCGSGVVARHLMDNGVAPRNIVGIDISEGQLTEARRISPNVTFLNMSADKLEVEPESFDLVVSNMALHHLDDAQFAKTLHYSYQALTEGGTFFFIDTHPEYDESLKESKAQNSWLRISTPWGNEQFLFNRDLKKLTYLTKNAGFDTLVETMLPIMPEGRHIDPAGYKKYTSRPSRIAVKLQKSKLRS